MVSFNGIPVADRNDMPANSKLTTRLAVATLLVSALGLVQPARAKLEELDALPKAVHRLNPHGDAHGANANSRHAGSSISYHGGPLLGTTDIKPVNVYVIWYGNWSGNTALTIVPNFLNSIGGSPYYNINTTYYNGSGIHIQNAVTYVGHTSDNYSQGASLSDAGVQAVVTGAINSGKLPSDLNGVYFVLTSTDVS